MNNLYKLLDKIESTIVDGVPIPLLPFTVVNHDKLYGLLDKIHAALPEEVQLADQILNKRDQLIEEAQRKAQLTLQEAKQHADEMVNDSELLRAVRFEAEKVRRQVMDELETVREQTYAELEQIRNQAIQEATLVRGQADEYANAVLKALAENLGQCLNSVQSGADQVGKVRQETNAKHQRQFLAKETKSPQQQQPSAKSRGQQPQANVRVENGLMPGGVKGQQISLLDV